MTEHNENEILATPRGELNRPGRRSAPALAWASAVLLSVLAAITALLALDKLGGLGLLGSPLQAQLMAAAKAVAASQAGKAPARYVEARSERGVVVVPLEEQYDRRRAVQMALELHDVGRRVQQHMAAATVWEYAGGSPDEPARQVAAIQKLASHAQSRLSDFLAIEPGQAAVILHALGWPWLNANLEELSVSDLRPTVSGLPAVLATISQGTLSATMAEVERSSWPAAYAQLSAKGAATENQLQAVRAHLCRRSAQRAFRRPIGSGRGRASVARYAVLTSAQARTVLAMCGALELVRSGTQAFPALIWLLERHPDLALPLLHRCVEANEIEQQARLAAAALSGPGASDARGELVALGPFGADALVEAMERYPPGVRKDAEALLQTVRQQWPQPGNALEALGSEARLWRKWYERAQGVL